MANCANHTDNPAVAYCRTCGKPLCEGCRREVQGVIYCEACLAARLGVAPPPVAAGVGGDPGILRVERRTPNPTVAAFLGFIPGVGAFYNGQYQKGLLHVLILPVIIVLANANEYFALLFMAYFPYMVIDAYATARAMERGEPLPDFFGITSMAGNLTPTNPAPAMGIADVNPAVAGGGRRPDAAPIGAVIMIGLGVLFLMNTMDVFHFNVGRLIAPLFLILFGAWKAFQRLAAR